MTPYAELAEVLGNLPMLLREACRARRITQQEAARQIGVSPSTVCRMIDGGTGSIESAMLVLLWLDRGSST